MAPDYYGLPAAVDSNITPAKGGRLYLCPRGGYSGRCLRGCRVPDATVPTINEYRKWLEAEQKLTVDDRLQNHYESVAARLFVSFRDSGFWQQLPHELQAYHERYLLDTTYPLLYGFAAPPILTKPFDSFLTKTYRKNVLDNPLWPDPPAGGWLLPDTCHAEINDVVRATLVVRYLDGVEVLLSGLSQYARSSGLGIRPSFEASEEGYYAAHLVVSTPVQVPKMTFDSVTIEGHLEIQITTQLQDVIKRLLHKYYEAARVRPSSSQPKDKWQWDYRSDEFLTNYLGHILHYVEGMIVEVRDRQTTKPQPAHTPGG